MKTARYTTQLGRAAHSARPGRESLSDAAINIVVACRRCNSARQAMSLAQFARYALALGVRFEPRAIRAQARRRLPEAA